MSLTGNKIIVSLAEYDLQRAFDGMSPLAIQLIMDNIKTLPPHKWEVWVREKLLRSPSSAYWDDIFFRSSKSCS